MTCKYLIIFNCSYFSANQKNGGQNARRDCAAQAIRIADRQHNIADAGLVAIAPTDSNQRLGRLDAQNGQVGLFIHTDQFGFQVGIVL